MTEPSLGGWLRDNMAAQAMSQAELSRRSGVSDSLVSKIIAGKITPEEKTLRDLGRVFNVPILHMLVLAGRITKEEAGIKELPAPPPPPPTPPATDPILEEIMSSKILTKRDKEELRRQHEADLERLRQQRKLREQVARARTHPA